MKIETKRCILRKFTPNDIDRFMEYRNNTEWMRYQGFKEQPRAVYEMALLKNCSLTTGMQFAIEYVKDHLLIGDIYLKQNGPVYWLGYTIHPDYAKQGLAVEAVTATIDWIFERGGVKIKAGVLPDNTASIKLLTRCGFSFMRKENDELIYELIR